MTKRRPAQAYRSRGRQKAIPMQWGVAKQLIAALRQDTIDGYSFINHEHRYYALMLLGFTTGMRATDLWRRTWDEFVGEDEEGIFAYEALVLYEHKKDHLSTVPSQRIPLFNSMRGLILELYRTVQPKDRKSFIFQPRNVRGRVHAKCWNAEQLRKRAKFLFKEYQVASPTPFYSLMRCTWARALYDHLLRQGMAAGEALINVQTAMNHRTPQMTSRYIGLGFYSEQLMEAVRTIGVLDDQTPQTQVELERSIVAEDRLNSDLDEADLDWESFTNLDDELVRNTPRLRARLQGFKG